MKRLENSNSRSGYEELPKRQGYMNIWPFVLFFLFCFSFGLGCFSLAHLRNSATGVQPTLKGAQVPLDSFPTGFLIGCSSSSYQIEGAWNEDGKGENIWDHLVHQEPSLIMNNDTGDLACDSYHQYKKDVQLIKNIGFQHYRFSVSWSRVLPTGHDDVINRAGIAYYHRLIDELLANGIQPMITLYHFDLPQPLQEIGGWTNPLMANYFENYARVIFNEFAPKVKWWITINEPRKVMKGYGREEEDLILAPNIQQPGVADYLAAHTLLRAHARAYRLYDSMFRPAYGGKISITLDATFYQPFSDSWDDKLATNRAFDFEVGIFAHPIFSKDGDYPRIMRERIDYYSNKEGRSASRLPKFTAEEIQEIRGSFDFFGLNHYTTSLVSVGKGQPRPSLRRDSGVMLSSDPFWKTAKSEWLKIVPSGMRGVLNYIKQKYDNPPVFITENGVSSDSGLQDYDRIQYYHDYLEEMLLAMHLDECNVIGYTVWSILDNFEWGKGFTERFGLHFVNFSDPSRPREKKMSADYFKKLIKAKRLPNIEKLMKMSHSKKEWRSENKYTG